MTKYAKKLRNVPDDDDDKVTTRTARAKLAVKNEQGGFCYLVPARLIHPARQLDT